MDANYLLDIIGNIDDEMLVTANNYRRNRNVAIKLGAIAACMCILIGGVTAISNSNNLTLPRMKKYKEVKA